MCRSHLLALTLALLALPSCAPDDADARVLILMNQFSGSGGECVLTPSEDEFIPFGTIDTDAPSGAGYLMTPLLKNFATVPQGTDQTQRIFFMEGADITIDVGNDSNGEPVFTDEEEAALADEGLLAIGTRFSGVVTPEEGLATLAFEILPREVIDAVAAKTSLEAEVLVSVQVYGSMAGGEVGTQSFAYPITVCAGCLYRNLGECSAIPNGFEAAQGGGCNLFQDFPIDCCTDSLGVERCPATAETIEDPEQ